MSPTDIAWAAGIVDGEGWICAFKNRPAKNGGYNFRFQSGVSNTDPRMCRKLQAMFGGSLSFEKRSKRYPGAKPYYSWHLHGRSCKPFLEAILPYLVVKREQAEVGLMFIETVLERRHVGGQGKRTPDETLETRREMYESLRALKAEVHS